MGFTRSAANDHRMRRRAVVAAIVLVSLLGGATAFGLVGGFGGDDGLRERWLSDTGTPVNGNHHAVAAGRVDGRGLVFVPVSGEAGTDQCRMAALDAADGSAQWDHRVPPAECMIHAVGTLTLADFDDDGTAEVLVPTSEERLYAFDPAGGEPELVHELSEYGYSQAAVGALGEDGGQRIAVVDARGTVEVVRPDGSTAWTHREDSYVWASPRVADLLGDGDEQLVVGFGVGFVTAFEGDGAVAWNRSLPGEGSVTWMTTAPAPGVTTAGDGGDAPTDVVVATDDGEVHLLEGPDGRVRWTREFGDLAAVGAVGDGDGDGSVEVYATAKDGVLRALDPGTGRTEWSTDLAEEPVQMTPPAVMGDLGGDGDPELVGVTSDGRVTAVDPRDGSVLGTYERSPPPWEFDASTAIWTRATLGDADGDGAAEIYVVYGDGRVAALEYEGS